MSLNKFKSAISHGLRVVAVSWQVILEKYVHWLILPICNVILYVILSPFALLGASIFYLIYTYWKWQYIRDGMPESEVRAETFHFTDHTTYARDLFLIGMMDGRIDLRRQFVYITWPKIFRKTNKTIHAFVSPIIYDNDNEILYNAITFCHTEFKNLDQFLLISHHSKSRYLTAHYHENDLKYGMTVIVMIPDSADAIRFRFLNPDFISLNQQEISSILS